MAKRSGSADLPLHGGRVPKWLGDRMTRLGAVITETIIVHYGRDEFLRRMAHPFWFQSFGAVMGMDWHSSGITTSVVGALKRGLTPVSSELGIHVCGRRGAQSRKTPAELLAIGDRVGLDAQHLVTTSRLVAKIDSAAVQDGFDLYLHGFIVTDDGHWVVARAFSTAHMQRLKATPKVSLSILLTDGRNGREKASLICLQIWAPTASFAKSSQSDVPTLLSRVFQISCRFPIC